MSEVTENCSPVPSQDEVKVEEQRTASEVPPSAPTLEAITTQEESQPSPEEVEEALACEIREIFDDVNEKVVQSIEKVDQAIEKGVTATSIGETQEVTPSVIGQSQEVGPQVIGETQEVTSTTVSHDQTTNQTSNFSKPMRSGRRPSNYSNHRSGSYGSYQNYGLTYLPYKSNFEPSEDARRRADEFLKTLKL